MLRDCQKCRTRYDDAVSRDFCPHKPFKCTECGTETGVSLIRVLRSDGTLRMEIELCAPCGDALAAKYVDHSPLTPGDIRSAQALARKLGLCA